MARGNQFLEYLPLCPDKRIPRQTQSLHFTGRTMAPRICSSLLDVVEGLLCLRRFGLAHEYRQRRELVLMQQVLKYSRTRWKVGKGRTPSPTGCDIVPRNTLPHKRFCGHCGGGLLVHVTVEVTEALVDVTVDVTDL